MYLRANLNPATVSEQAFAKVVVKPLTLIATPTPRAVGGSLNSVRVLVRTVPERALSSITVVAIPAAMVHRRASLVASAPMSAVCNAAAGECQLRGGRAPTRLIVTATTTQGITLTTTAAVDSLPCPTGDLVLDSKEMRTLIDSIWRIGGNQGNAADRRERTAMLIDSGGVHVIRHYELDTNSTPCTTTWATNDITQFIPPKWVVGVMTIVSVIHTHPFSLRDKFPSNCPPRFRGQRAGIGPSYADWDNSWKDMYVLNNKYKNDTNLDLFSPFYKPMIVDPDYLWLIDPRSTIPWGTVVSDSVKYTMADTLIVGNNLQGWKRKKPFTNNSCVTKASDGPTTVK
jgi:hypothetical protein